MAKFKIGDKVKSPDMDELYEIIEVDEISESIPKYKVTRLKDNLKTFWDYCIDWIKFVSPDDSLRYGHILTDDIYYVDGLNGGSHRIRIIRYDNRIFYHKMVNGEVVEFKELTI